jgi:spore coat protein U domain-containing protein, fimbrial subunit CupE1/2/3/6
MKCSISWVIAFALALLAAPQARADVTCTASNITVNFGPYDVLAGTTLPGSGSFRVTCVNVNTATTRVTYTARFATSPARQMAPPSGSDRVDYEIYLNAAHSQVWGDGTGGTFVVTGNLRVRRNRTATSGVINVYGLIAPGGQDVSAASPAPPPTSYAQTLVVTVTCTPQC